jgi:gas vesicle protein
MKKQTKAIAAGTILAIAAGYVTGKLTAPQKGSETRKELVEAAAKRKMQTERSLKKLHTEIGDLLDKSKDKAHVVADKAHAEFKEAVNKASQARQKAKVMISAVRSGEAEDPDLQEAVKEAKTAKDHLKSFLKK